MSKHIIGMRVGAISHADEDHIYLFGYGVYDGYKIPSPTLGVSFFGVPLTHENPQITLDNGKLVYGCECWWGPEEVVKAKIGNRVVVWVDIEKARREALETN